MADEQSKFEIVQDDVPFVLKKNTVLQLQCCDCGLVHDVTITRMKASSSLELCFKRNYKLTEQARRERGIKR